LSEHHAHRILIIDNDEDLARAIATRLRHLGYSCMTAASGAQGLSIFQANDVNLVITDLNMPHGDGIQVLETIRRSSDVPAIVITGFNSEYRDQLRRIRGVTRVVKPFESEALVDLVELELGWVHAGGNHLAGDDWN
jgi:DNA-binding response OmpR family regulator